MYALTSHYVNLTSVWDALNLFASNSCWWGVVVVVEISQSRFTGTITINARLATEIFLSSLQSECPSNLLVNQSTRFSGFCGSGGSLDPTYFFLTGPVRESDSPVDSPITNNNSGNTPRGKKIGWMRHVRFS
jgi:hypothetical protein